MACIAPHRCRSIAVASPLGLCVLDAWRGNNKWKRFDKAEENQFRVLAMEWWEDSNDEEDFLIAIIELVATSHRFLAGWARRRLDLSHQLLEHIDDYALSTSIWGIPLPSTFYPNSISILTSSPIEKLQNNNNRNEKDQSESRKAVVLVTDTGNTLEPSLLIFQLQTQSLIGKSEDRERDARTMVIKCSLALHGGLSSDQENIFLANAFFRFNLLDTHQSPKTLSVNESDQLTYGKDDSIVAILGMITPQGEIKVAIATKGALLLETTLLKKGTISKISLSNVFNGFHFWTMELVTDRSLWCWAAPPAERKYLICENVRPTDCLPISSLLRPPHSIVSQEHDDHGRVWFGTLSCVGDSAMWMLGLTDSTRSQCAVGCVPSSAYGCVMHLGQDGSSYSHEIIPQGQIDHFAGLIQHESFQVGSASIAMPIFLFSLIDHLLTDEQLLINDPELKLWAQTRNYFSDLLQESQHINTTFTALRLLLLRSVEAVSSVAPKKKGGEKIPKPKEGREHYKTARGFFTRIVTLLKEMLNTSLFANLMLSVARQIEPSCMEHLFPLPQELSPLLTIEDFYLQAIERGSLGTPSSSLPLLSNKLSALEECKEILYHCLWKLASIKNTTEFDTTREERKLVRDLFRFATQLEVMTDFEFYSDEVKLNAASMITTEEKKTTGIADKDLLAEVSLTHTSRKKFRSTLSALLTPLSCIRSRQKDCDIYKVNNSFISSTSEETEYEALNQGILISERGAKVSVMFLTGKILVRLCVEDGKGGWTRAAILAQLVLGDTVIDESGKGVLEWFQRSSLPILAEAAHKLSNSINDLDLSNQNEMTKVVTQYLIQGVCAAKEEMMSTNNGAWLLELIILSLSRLLPTDSINITSHVAPSLVLLAIIVGHVSGRMEDMVKGW
eukprot:CAMPEP_0194163202 /NCGR_PEP_ID=MMETSP0152-20130528/79913_1 /TAXON_ID=1049557 /ORGANISM="Thalassiothrix antarctica, Strain L6-D1" /LENGTH=900 /DNA_ID=CAMNT_0038873175 /DNA_START=1796 /DNA_END=4495 /DNA_ORIENTATION=+